MSTPHNEKSYSLKNLFLDPNNYRFLDKNDYAECSDEDAIQRNVQNRTFDLIRGKNNSNIADLLASFMQNGYLPVDQIQVRKIGHQKYLVIEGNRRVAALQVLEHMYQENRDIGQFNPEIFKKVPVVDYETQDIGKFKVLMGLKHISGNKKWPAINQAKLLDNLLNEHKMTEEEIWKSLGISKQEIRSTRRTLSLIKKYEESDFGDQFTSEKYSTFREVIKNTKIKDWLDISPNDLALDNINEKNLYRLFSWLSTTEEEISDDDIENEDTHTIYVEPIIETALQIRELGKIISDENAINNLETTRSLIDATLSSENLGKNKLENSLNLIKDQINTAFNYSYLIDEGKIEDISTSIRKLNALLVTSNRSVIDETESHIEKSPLHSSITRHFSSLEIRMYKRFVGLKVEKLNRVNIFAGVNNAGKSTVLEALYILSNLGDSKCIHEISNLRSKSRSRIKPSISFREIPDVIDLECCFNDSKYYFESKVKDSVDEIKNQSDFIGRHSTTFGCTRENSVYIYYSDYYKNHIRNHATTNKTLCRSLYTESSFLDDASIFETCYRLSVEQGTKKLVVDFIIEHIDDKIVDIEMSSNDGSFTVIYEDPTKNRGLSQFGDGLQKIFSMGIKFAACTNGILLIDEIENGIHKDLLCQFTMLIQELADQHNVQVFATSHSKECIDAFISNNFKNEQISAYAIDSIESKVEHFSGEDLEELIDYINLDIRGTKQ